MVGEPLAHRGRSWFLQSVMDSSERTAVMASETSCTMESVGESRRPTTWDTSWMCMRLEEQMGHMTVGRVDIGPGATNC